MSGDNSLVFNKTNDAIKYENFLQIQQSGDFDVSIVLDTLMYTDGFANITLPTNRDMSVKEIVEQMKDKNLKADGKLALKCVKDYIKTHQDFGELKLNSASAQKGKDYNGVFAATFYSEKEDGSKDVYVAFKGTGEGRWYDNADTLCSEHSLYQGQSVKYFDEAMKQLGISDKDKIIVTGHSKGGNNAQYVALESKYARYIDNVYSFYGQGMSKAEIESVKNRYGEQYFQTQIGKMYSFNSETDYVHQLGYRIIPDSHTYYFKNKSASYDAYNAHSFFDGDGIGNIFDYVTGHYELVNKPSELTMLAGSLSANVMMMDPELKEDVCRTLMTIAERLMNGHWDGINGEAATEEEFIGLIECSAALINNAIFSWEGQCFIQQSFTEYLEGLINVDSKAAKPYVDAICNITALVITGCVDAVALFLEPIICGISEVAICSEGCLKFAGFCKSVGSSIKKWANNTFNWNHKDASAYISRSSLISLDTEELREMADKIKNINLRLADLDDRLDGLWSKVKWTDLWDLLMSDLRIGYSKKLEKCANYLSNTANYFETAESNISTLING